MRARRTRFSSTTDSESPADGHRHLGPDRDCRRRTHPKSTAECPGFGIRPDSVCHVASRSGNDPASPYGERAVQLLFQLVHELVTEVAAFDEVQAKLAISAFARFGKGMGHPAQLN